LCRLALNRLARRDWDFGELKLELEGADRGGGPDRDHRLLNAEVDQIVEERAAPLRRSVGPRRGAKAVARLGDVFAEVGTASFAATRPTPVLWRF